jgi:hypothetical protein
MTNQPSKVENIGNPQSRTIQMKGQNKMEPSFVHSLTPMNKGKVKDEREKQFSDI